MRSLIHALMSAISMVRGNAEPHGVSGRSLLFVSLDDTCGPDLRAIGVFAEFTKSPSLPQEIPVLVQLDADLLQSYFGMVVS
jgi:hypothetical protein